MRSHSASLPPPESREQGKGMRLPSSDQGEGRGKGTGAPGPKEQTTEGRGAREWNQAGKGQLSCGLAMPDIHHKTNIKRVKGAGAGAEAEKGPGKGKTQNTGE